MFTLIEQYMANTEIAFCDIARIHDMICEAQRKVMSGDLCS